MKAFIAVLIWTIVTISPALAMSGKRQAEPKPPSGLVEAHPIDPVLAFANWCQARLGRLSLDQSQCVTQLNYRFGKKEHHEVWSSAVKVAPNDTVTVTASGSPKVLVGLYEGNTELAPDGTFVAPHDGILAFSAPGKGKKFSVSQVEVRRCFELSGKNTLCASGESTASSEMKKRKRPASVAQSGL